MQVFNNQSSSQTKKLIKLTWWIVGFLHLPLHLPRVNGEFSRARDYRNRVHRLRVEEGNGAGESSLVWPWLLRFAGVVAGGGGINI